MPTFEEKVRGGGEAALVEAGRFFMRESPVHKALQRIASELTRLNIPYAVVGGMAVNAHGLFRTTEDVDVLVTPEGLKRAHESLEELEYLPPFAGSKQLRDMQNQVRIEFLVTGQFPGDGKPKPVAFPDPAGVTVEVGGVRFLNLPTLIELKLASAMTGAGRSKDYGDVEALIDLLNLPVEFGARLNEYVRGKFEEKWREMQLAREQRARNE
jgi:hypothetical protein